MRPIRDLGLISNLPVRLNGKQVVPRDLFIAVVEPKLLKPGSPDVVVLRVVVTGMRGGKEAGVHFNLIDYSDETRGLTAMMRTTGFSLALTALMQANGTISAVGVRTPDQAVPFQPYVEGLAKFGVRIGVAEV